MRTETSSAISVWALARSMTARITPFLVLFLAGSFLIRATLAGRVFGDYADTFLGRFRPFLIGPWYDLTAFAGIAIAVILWWLFLPARLAGSRFDRSAALAGFTALAFTIAFTAVGEHLFWTEFGTRYNFIAVDYLVYTQEVIGNIWESYPIIPLVLAVAAAAAAVTYTARHRIVPPTDGKSRLLQRLPVALAGIGIAVGLLAATTASLATRSTNAVNNELALNGLWALFSAFWNNEIDYRRFYKTIDDKVVLERMRAQSAEVGAVFVDPSRDPLTRDIQRTGPMLRKNVMLVGLESMGAEYMAAHGNKDKITPNLDRLAGESLHFTRMLSTGTRTVRGLEALTLAVPPTPGQSIVRRPGNANLYSLGWVFKDRGYDTRFIYGGYGYFDNMNAFFAANGFAVTDRRDLAKSEITFENVWGVSDEDLYRRSIREADASHAANKPFFQFVMTTSNHRPFTYPGGKIDILSKSGRLGGVKYADYAIGAFLKEAQSKPWYKDTIFVFIGDHTAGTSGKVELDPTRYHVASMIYAPGIVKAQRYDKLSSHIDVPPTLLGLLNTSYRSRFYGKDVLNDPNIVPRAYIGIYQKVALVRDEKTVVLGPKSTVEAFQGLSRAKSAEIDPAMVTDAIAAYQFASGWATVSKRIETRIGQQATEKPN
jgi:phosphoglycerol transferase MdoB-like AlkP superfamily enzyme